MFYNSLEDARLPVRVAQMQIHSRRFVSRRGTANLNTCSVRGDITTRQMVIMMRMIIIMIIIITAAIITNIVSTIIVLLYTSTTSRVDR